MSLKEKLTSLLFGPKAAGEEEGGAQIEQGYAAEQTAEAQAEGIFDRSLLELPAEHPLCRLYELRRQEAGYLPAPHLSLDEEGVFPEEMIQRELGRLRTSLTSLCSSRMKQVKDHDKSQLRKKKGQEEAAEAEPLSLDAQPCFFLSSDKLFAWIMILPPVGQGQELTQELLLKAALDQNVTYGLDEHLIERLPVHDKRYFHLFLIARGKPAFDGENGNIVDYFPRVSVHMLDVDEYGQVDYTNLNLIRNVKKDQEICRLILPTDGEPGRTVLSEEIPAKSGKSVPLPKGRNTEISEDGLSLLATIDGHVEFTGRSFQVKPVLDIPGNVDYSTGDINFLGDINVKGDVLTGFTVRAMGNIHVAGVVEAGSSVEAGGDLVVVKGILGDGTTIVRAHRSIFSKYIENATIYARENLQTDCIINSRIYCDGEIQVRSGRGCIMGGRVWAARLINAKSIGAQSECRTAVALGGLPCTNFEREVIQEELKELEIELEKMECQLDSPAKTSLLSKTRMKLSVAELKLKQLEEDLDNIKIELMEKEHGRLECAVLYPGTEISFGDEVLRVRQERRQCVAKLVCGEIVLM